MKVIENIIKVFLGIVILYAFCHYFFIFKDVVLSIGAKRNLTGKIVYSINALKVKVIELPSGEKKTIYKAEETADKYLEHVLNPYFSPSGRKIVFTKMPIDAALRYRLYMMDTDGTNVKKILDLGDASISSPSWSPDGSKIAFVVKDKGLEGLYIIDAYNPSDYKRICAIEPARAQPAWSPDSQKVVFISEELYRSKIGDNLYAEKDLGGAYIVEFYENRVRKIIEYASEVSWSPDSKSLICKKGDGYYLITLTDNGYTKDIQRIIPYETPIYGKPGSLPIRWSPDGKYIVFCKDIWFGFTGIYVAPIDNPKKHIRIATDGTDIVGMSWVR